MTSGRAPASSARLRRCSTKRARQRLGEDALGQAERERLALALVAGFVARDQRHHHFGAGPGMVGQILDGLRRRRSWCAPAAGPARNRAARTADARGLVAFARVGASALRANVASRFGHAVIVLEPVGQKQRAARLLLGILGERNRRRLVGNGVERPGQIVAGAAQRRRAGRRDLEAIFLGAGRRMHLVGIGDVTPPLPATSRLSLPVARTTSVEPTGTDTGPSCCAVAVALRPDECRPE